jgi:hypothetical protein
MIAFTARSAMACTMVLAARFCMAGGAACMYGELPYGAANGARVADVALHGLPP